MNSLQDIKVVDNACIALSHIVEALSPQSSLIAKLCEEGGLLNQTLQLVCCGHRMDGKYGKIMAMAK
jgi:hypothetical protein